MPKKPVIAIVDDDGSAREATMSLMRALGLASEAYQCAEVIAPLLEKGQCR